MAERPQLPGQGRSAEEMIQMPGYPSTPEQRRLPNRVDWYDNNLEAFLVTYDSHLLDESTEREIPSPVPLALQGLMDHAAEVWSMTVKKRRFLLRGLLKRHAPLRWRGDCGNRLGSQTRVCSSPSCPRCGRHQQAELLVDTLVRTKDMPTMVMLTLTIKTTPQQPLSGSWAAITRVWKRCLIEQTLRRHGWSWLRMPEVTYSIPESGWHVHFHVLLFTDSTDMKTLHAEVTTMTDRWVTAAARVGIVASEHAQRFDFVSRSDRPRVVSYAVKPIGLYLGEDDDGDYLPDHDDEWAEPVRYLTGVSPAFLGTVAALEGNEDARRLYLEVIANPGVVSRGGILRGAPRNQKSVRS